MTKKYIKIIIVLFIIILTLFAVLWYERTEKARKELTIKEKVEDFNYLYKSIEENYVFLELQKRITEFDWLKNKQLYLERVEATKNDEEFYRELDSILRELGNGHCRMYETSKEEIYSLLQNTEKAMKLGYKFNWSEKCTLDILYNKAFLKRNNINLKEVWKKQPKDKNIIYNYNNEIITKDIKKGNIGYVYLKSFRGECMEKDKEILYPYLESIKNYKALVIDIRDNPGGTDLYWRNLLVSKLIKSRLVSTNYSFFKGGQVAEEYLKYDYGKDMCGVERVDENLMKNFPNLSKEISTNFKYYTKNIDEIEPKDSINFEGRIYLLVNHIVYSASESFASFCKSTKFATIIGEKTGGDGLGIAPVMKMLPNSCFIFQYPIVMGVDFEGKCNDEYKTEPDINIKEASRGEGFQMDNCIDAVLKMEEK